MVAKEPAAASDEMRVYTIKRDTGKTDAALSGGRTAVTVLLYLLGALSAARAEANARRLNQTHKRPCFPAHNSTVRCLDHVADVRRALGPSSFSPLNLLRAPKNEGRGEGDTYPSYFGPLFAWCAALN